MNVTTTRKWIGAALLAGVSAYGGYQGAPGDQPAVPMALFDARSAGPIDVVDDEKLAAEAAVHDVLAAGETAGRLQRWPSTAHLGVIYGQLRQTGTSHDEAVAAIVALARTWAEAQPWGLPGGIAGIGDNEILDILAKVDRITVGDWGGAIDLGFQYGVRFQAGQPAALARQGTGEWLVRWYGGENPWGSALPPPAPPPPAGRVGTLRLTSAGFADDSGPVLPLYAHHGNALSLFNRDEAAELAQLNDVAAAGYQGIRYWNQLGCGRETTQQGCPGGMWRPWVNGPDVTPDYWPKLRRFAEALRERGLRAVVSQGDINQLRDRCGYMRRLAELDREVGGFIDFIDGANEGTVTGEGDERALARFIQCYADAGGTGLKSTTSGDSEGTDDVNRFAIPPSDVFDIHSYRADRVWDWIRHIFSSGYEGHYRLPFGMQSEPAGGGRLVSNISHREDADDESVPLMAVASFIGRQAFVWFSGEGVIVDRGLRTEPGFYTVPRAVAWLPREMLAWTRVYHGGKPEGILGPASADGGVVRTDCREGEGRAVCVTYGPPGTYHLPVKRGFVGRYCNPGDGACVDLDLRRGQTLPVTFSRGRVLIVDRFQ